ncbi:DNA ligase 1-like [Anneissia japonica]|uniref:DNA ligase 1-like n=1 Tax=Anneissia japonica TaxID=1529436 RepID=UPI001425BA90|nr:DNA ligase 1-like [Anneissia japonica]
MVNMDSSTTTKVSKRVARKINHYLNKERVESEYDPSGNGLHTTNPLMAKYELAYLVTTEDKNLKSLQKEKDQSSDSQMLVLPCLVPSAQCKSHVRKSDAKRVTVAAREIINSLPVKEIDMIRRYRPSCRATDTIENGKVSQMSRSVHAMLNTKEAVDFAVKHDKKTQRMRSKSAHQLRRSSITSADGMQSSRSSNYQHKMDSSVKLRKKKLRQRYTELPFGPGNSSHIATWLSEQRMKDIKAMKNKEKQKKRAEKEAEIEKERRDKEEITTAMESLQIDVAKSNDKDEKNNANHIEESNENGRKGRSKNRKHEKHKDKKRKEKVGDNFSSCSSRTNPEDELDDVKHLQEKSEFGCNSRHDAEESSGGKVDPKHENDKCDINQESTDTKCELVKEPITETVHDVEPMKVALEDTDSHNKTQGPDESIVNASEKEKDHKEENIEKEKDHKKGNIETKHMPMKASYKDSEKDENRSIDTNVDRSKGESGQASVKTVEYARTESMVSLPRS